MADSKVTPEQKFCPSQDELEPSLLREHKTLGHEALHGIGLCVCMRRSTYLYRCISICRYAYIQTLRGLVHQKDMDPI